MRRGKNSIRRKGRRPRARGGRGVMEWSEVGGGRFRKRGGISAPRARELVTGAEGGGAGENVRSAAKNVKYLKNEFRPWAPFQRNVAEVENRGTSISPPIQHFIKLQSPSPDPAALDEAV